MSQQSDHESATHLLGALKSILKERRLGYQAIADSLDLSLPTVKRMLNKASIPLDRLLAICRLAEIQPGEVFALAEKMAAQHGDFFCQSEDDPTLFHLDNCLALVQADCSTSSKHPTFLAIGSNGYHYKLSNSPL